MDQRKVLACTDNGKVDMIMCGRHSDHNILTLFPIKRKKRTAKQKSYWYEEHI